MADPLRIAYLAHSFRSDWNNGNAHFLRGLMRAMVAVGHEVRLLEPETEWSLQNLRAEPLGQHALAGFTRTFAELDVRTYPSAGSSLERFANLELLLEGTSVVILHEWNPPALAHFLLGLRRRLGFKLVFHDTHHRASSSPQQIEAFGLREFDGVLAFGEALRCIYRERFGIERVWTLHEAADTTVFHPLPDTEKRTDVVWVGNWGEGERTSEIRSFLLEPAAALGSKFHFKIYGVRYPSDGLEALGCAGVEYGGYLPNLDAPAVYAASRMTVHIPRQIYSTAMTGIPTIRVFEALACGIPLVSAPWEDCEGLFRPQDFLMARDPAEMMAGMEGLLQNPEALTEQARCGLETILARHTCAHRASELTRICAELN